MELALEQRDEHALLSDNRRGHRGMVDQLIVLSVTIESQKGQLVGQK